MNEKYIFLDFDGVLNSWPYLAQVVDVPHGVRHIDPDAVFQLQRVVDATGARIVVSSTWRKLYSVQELSDMLAENGLMADVIDVTPSHNNGYRGHEIQQWLDDHFEFDDYPTFVIVDDGSDMEPFMDHFVQTEIEYGLTPDKADEMIEKLGGMR